MKKRQDRPADAAERRRRAEEQLKRQGPEGAGQMPEAEMTPLVHELEVHQIELEMQNEELQQARARADALLSQYTDLYDFAPAGYMTLDREGVIRQVNLTGARLLGVERSRLVNRRFGLFVAEGDRRAFSDFLQQVLAGHAKVCCEVALPQEGHPPLFVLIEATVSADGQECRAVVVDITERRQAETQMRAAQAETQRLLALSEQSRGALLNAVEDELAATEALQRSLDRFEMANRATFNVIWHWILQTNAVWWNQNLQTLFGYRAEEIEPGIESWTNRIDPEDLHRVKNGIYAAIDSGEQSWFDTYRFRRKDGSYADVEDRAHIVREASGRAVQMIGAMRDITDHKQAEAALRESEEQFRAMFELASIGMAQADPRTGQWLRVNQKLCAITGYSADEMLRMQVLEITHPDDRQQDWDAYQRVVRGEAPDYRLENRYVRKDGSITWVNVNMTVIRNAAGQPMRTMAAIEDISERMRTAEEICGLNAELEQRVLDRTVELRAANQELDAFSYSVSHDLRAPVRAVIGFAHLLQEDHAAQLDSEGRRILAVIASEGGRMGHLIDDLLAFSRLGRGLLARTRVDMEALARTVFAELAGREPGRTLRLSLEPLPPVRGDPSMLRQVWVNLLSNAIKYTSTREVAQINIGSRTEGGEITYSVQDNGVGFDMKYAGRLFGVFQRLHSEAAFAGTGVGLALVQRILHRHGGRVWVDARIDAGATFFFTLPPAGNA